MDSGCLPVSSADLGVRSVSKLASSAFLDSAAGTLSIQTLIMQRSNILNEEYISSSLTHWKLLSGQEDLLLSAELKQKSLHSKVSVQVFNDLLESQHCTYHRSRLLPAAKPHGSDWLHALPTTSSGLRLPDEAVRIAVGLHTGALIRQTHHCPCGSQADDLGAHAFSCKQNPGRSQRHYASPQ